MTRLNEALGTNRRQAKNVKLLEKDLNSLVSHASKMIRSRYEQKILPYEKRSVRKLFQDEAVDVNNWTSAVAFKLFLF